jgi:hypothetical protein
MRGAGFYLKIATLEGLKDVELLAKADAEI